MTVMDSLDLQMTMAKSGKTGLKVDLNETDYEMNFALAKRKSKLDSDSEVRTSDLGQVMVQIPPLP